MELTKEMEALIAQHLPQMAAGQMTEFITQAKRDAAALADVKARLENTEQQLKDYREKAAAVEQMRRVCEERTSRLEAEAKKLRDGELALDLATNKLIADVALAELKGVKETMGQFLRNVTVRSSVVENIGIPVTGNNAGWVHDKTQTRVETKDQE